MTLRLWHWPAALALACIAVACSDDQTSPGTGGADGALDQLGGAEVLFGATDAVSQELAAGTDDVGPFDASQGQSDAGPDFGGNSCEFDKFAPKGEPGSPCSIPQDCNSGLCIETADGKICTRSCQTCCPTGFACKEYSTGAETTFLCAPKFVGLCQPCLTDAECQQSDAGALCVANGGFGSFCGGACSVDADCPGGYVCQQSQGEKGAAKQCVLANKAVCTCSQRAIFAGAVTNCSVANTFGTCGGTRKCVPGGLSDCNAPGATAESCNALDDDCDGQTDELGAGGCTVWYVDADKDGVGSTPGDCTCAPTGAATASSGGDCADNDAAVLPGAQELCNDKDDDCDGQTDEGCDGDGDGWCSGGKTGGQLLKVCTKGLGDCDDSSAAIQPGIPDACGDGVDNNCDGITDAGSNVTGCSNFYADADNDGFGLGVAVCLCAKTPAYPVTNNLDCNDGTVAISPSATETCNNQDDDCDGVIDEGCDGDGDGYCDASLTGGSALAACPKGIGDCNDKNALVNPGRSELCGNKVDDDCDGATDLGVNPLGCDLFYLDADKDGFGSATAQCLCGPTSAFSASNSLDCNDGAVGISPAATEACNNVDDDCDGTTDEGCDGDGDGYCDAVLAGGAPLAVCPKGSNDCNDKNALVNPGRTELCGNSLDDDCDGGTDLGLNAIGCALYYADGDKDGFGGSASQCLCGPNSAFASSNSLDCNDNVAGINPGATETCNTLDDNCNSLTDEGAATGCSTYYTDADQDGFSAGGESQCLCAPSGGYTTKLLGDCDDQTKGTNPDATETCNNKDDDCDSQTDEPDAQGCTVWYADQDNDLYGGASQCLCAKDTVYKLAVGGDCNDFDDNIAPDAQEYCNLGDDDCDGQTDEVDAFGCSLFYQDSDKDGFGNTALGAQCLCKPAADWTSSVPGDCNDTKLEVNPNAQEVCNSEDDDCDTQTDPAGSQGCQTFYRDNDGDTYGINQTACLCGASAPFSATNALDCNDGLPLVNPAGTETCNGIDDNCNSQTDEDLLAVSWPDNDGDGWGATTGSILACGTPQGYSAKTGDCNDSAPAIHPGVQTESCNGLDDNCNSITDEGLTPPTWYQDGDGDGYGKPGTALAQCVKPTGYVPNADDCNDADGSIKPGATEICDGKDNDCAGGTDNGLAFVTYYEDKDLDTYGNPAVTKSACSQPAGYVANNQDCNDNSNAFKPGATETCDLLDNDCDGSTDEGLTQNTYYLDADGDGYGVASPTVKACKQPTGYSTNKNDCNDSNAGANPGLFSGVLNEDLQGCNGVDNDCDGYTDNGEAWPYYLDGDGDGFGTSGTSVSVCIGSAPPAGYVRDGSDCADGNPSRYPGATEIAGNGVDEDCYGGDLAARASCSAVTITQFETGPWGFALGPGWTWDYYFEPCVLFCTSGTYYRRLAYANNKQNGYAAAAAPGSTASTIISIPDKTVSIQFDLQFDNSTGTDIDDYPIPDTIAYVEARVGGGAWVKTGPFSTYQGNKKTVKIPASSFWLTSQLLEIRVVASKSTDSFEGFFIDNLQAVCN